MADLRYIDGIQQALLEEMSRDASIRVMGEDVTLGGPFGATKGLVEELVNPASSIHPSAKPPLLAWRWGQR